MFLSSALDAWPLQELQARSNTLQIDVAYVTSWRLGIVHPRCNKPWLSSAVGYETPPHAIKSLGPLPAAAGHRVTTATGSWHQDVIDTTTRGQCLWGSVTPDPFVFPLEQLLQPDRCLSTAFKATFSWCQHALARTESHRENITAKIIRILLAGFIKERVWGLVLFLNSGNTWQQCWESSYSTWGLA